MQVILAGATRGPCLDMPLVSLLLIFELVQWGLSPLNTPLNNNGGCVFLCVQFKWGLSEHLGASAEELVLIHSSRVLKDSEPLSHFKGLNGSVRLSMIQRYEQPALFMAWVHAVASNKPTFGINKDKENKDIGPDLLKGAKLYVSPITQIVLIGVVSLLGIYKKLCCFLNTV